MSVFLSDLAVCSSYQEYIDEAKQQQSEASERLAMVDSKIEQTKQLAQVK